MTETTEHSGAATMELKQPSAVTQAEAAVVTPSHRPVDLFIKRAFDIVASLSGLIILSPVLLITAIAIYIDDPHASPIIVQTRIGKGGVELGLLKFRSMVADAEDLLDNLSERNEADGPVFKIKEDPRITRVGKINRRTCRCTSSILERLERGYESGRTKTPLPREIVQYTVYQRQRLKVKPGITCLWQIRPGRNKCRFDEWVELDLKYIREASIGTEFKILFSMIAAVLRLDSE